MDSIVPYGGLVRLVAVAHPGEAVAPAVALGSSRAANPTITTAAALANGVNTDLVMIDWLLESSLQHFDNRDVYQVETMCVNLIHQWTVRSGKYPCAVEETTLGPGGHQSGRSKTWVRAVDARARLIDATIELLGEIPFAEITTTLIAERSGTNRPAITRNFGSLAGLFNATAQELVDRSMSRAQEQSSNTAIFDSDLILRTRLVAWLLGTGVDPSLLQAREGFPARQMAQLNPTGLDEVSETTARVFNELLFFAAEGFIVFSEIHSTMEDGDLLRSIAFLNELRNHLPAIERGLGWEDAPSEPES
jgi:AcrR family transcriptional regulator